MGRFRLFRVGFKRCLNFLTTVVMGATMGRFLWAFFYKPFFWDHFLHIFGIGAYEKMQEMIPEKWPKNGP